ncbi:MAG: hypothetical protein M0Z89_13520 [Nitrospiraceae bacterium]|nr:hypothetical protein [Nitrospiraceae bacterium]
MLMKIVTYVLIALLVVTLGAAAFFYLNYYQPMAADYARMKAGIPELDKAKAELKKIKEKESKETAWLSPAVDAVSSSLSNEIKNGKAEVLTAGNKVIVNIAEDELFMPGSYTFIKDDRLRRVLDSLLRDEKVKGKIITIGNTTQSVPAHGKGRKKIPAKDARTLAADRSAALVKYLEKSGVSQDALVAAAYSSKQPEIGFKLKDHKTVIIIENPPATPSSAIKQGASKEAPATKASTTASAAPQKQPKGIPIQPAQPKTN